MKFHIPRLFLLIALGVLPGATSYGLVNSRPEDGGGADPILMQQRRMQTMPALDSAANRQAAWDRRNQEVRDALSRPPVGWAHYDQPPALRANFTTAASAAFTAEPSRNLWIMLIGALLLGCGVTFAATLFMPRRASAPSRQPKNRLSRHDGPSQLDR